MVNLTEFINKIWLWCFVNSKDCEWAHFTFKLVSIMLLNQTHLHNVYDFATFDWAPNAWIFIDHSLKKALKELQFEIPFYTLHGTDFTYKSIWALNKENFGRASTCCSRITNELLKLLEQNCLVYLVFYYFLLSLAHFKGKVSRQ